MSLPRYVEYRDSGIKWLGKMPAHWQVRRTKFLFDLMKRPVAEDDGIVTAFRDGQVTLRSNRRVDGFTNALQEIGYQGVRSGDLVIHAMDAFAGAIGVSESDGKSTPVYSVCQPKVGVSNPYYYASLLRYMALGGFINSLAKGIRERSTDFRWADASALFLPLPSLEEQKAIVDFLDRETAKIDALIAEQEKLLALLAEKRQATISHAVTRGLDPSVPMKDSGISWLGELPAHWEVTPLKHLCSLLKDGTHLPPPRVEDGIPLLSVRNIDDSVFAFRSDDSMISIDDYEELCRAFVPQVGDVLMAIVGATLGKVAVIREGMNRFHIQRSLAIFRPRPVLLADWLFYCISSGSFQRLLWEHVGFSAQPGIYLGTLQDFRMPVPPLEEQADLVSALAANISKLDVLASEAERAVVVLKERRTALIAAAVTGQIDVRGAAAC